VTLDRTVAAVTSVPLVSAMTLDYIVEMMALETIVTFDTIAMRCCVSYSLGCHADLIVCDVT
jgi:hypothetical protein